MNETKPNPVVLAVDDDRMVLRLIEAKLTGHNYVVKTASRGEEALKILGKITPAVLILDVMMAGISGYDVCRFVKQEERLKDIPVIFLTSQDTPKDYKTGHELGAVMYVATPIKQDQILRAVQMLSATPTE
jgi:two-component system sensor histidine kinase ChiS